MKLKINIYKTLIYLILLFVPINLLKDIFPIPLTLIVGGAILIFMVLILFNNITKSQLIIMLCPIVLFIMGLLVTDDYTTHIRYFLNWYALLCTLLICADKRKVNSFLDHFHKNKKSIHVLMEIIFVIMIVLLLSPNAYSGGWWGLSKGFVAFTVSHAVASSACAFLLYEILYLQDNHSKIAHLEGTIFLGVSLFMVFQTGARIYVISILAISIVYVFDIIRSTKKRFIIISLGLVFILFLFTHSAFMEKNEIVLNYQIINGTSFLNSITSGRTMIWYVDLIQYLKSGIYTILFGRGFAYSYELNRKFYYGFDIFSHNIFLETALSLGLIGLFILIVVLRKVFKNIKNQDFSTVVLWIYVIIVGFINGLFDSQIYCYSILIFILVVFNTNKSRK